MTQGGPRPNSGPKRRLPEGTRKCIFRLRPDQVAKLDRLAAELETNRTEIVRAAIDALDE